MKRAKGMPLRKFEWQTLIKREYRATFAESSSGNFHTVALISGETVKYDGI